MTKVISQDPLGYPTVHIMLDAAKIAFVLFLCARDDGVGVFPKIVKLNSALCFFARKS